MNTQQDIQKREELKNRLARQEGRISDRLQHFEELKEQVKKEFGTDDLTQLRSIYSDLKKKKEALLDEIGHGNALIERAVESLENGEAMPADVVNGLEKLAQSAGKTNDTADADESSLNDTNTAQEDDTDDTGSGLNPEFEKQDTPEEDLLPESNSEQEAESHESEPLSSEDAPDFDPLQETVSNAENARNKTMEQAAETQKQESSSSKDNSDDNSKFGLFGDDSELSL